MVNKVQHALEEDCLRLQLKLRRLFKCTKRKWADEYIHNADLWEVASWRHRRQTALIPALKDNEGNLQYRHQAMTDLLSERFFAASNTIPPTFHDNPPPHTPRSFIDFSTDKIEWLLKETKNSSALGELGIGYLLLKKAWLHISVTLTNVYSACVRHTTPDAGNQQQWWSSPNPIKVTTPPLKLTIPFLF